MARIPSIAVGPWGGNGGRAWDDGAYTTIRKVIICHGDVVDSVQIEYDDNGVSKLSEVHGGLKGTPAEVKLDYTNGTEYLISISGHYSKYFGAVVIGSLTITSNKKEYGPYGNAQTGQYFSTSSLNGGKIVGFFGRGGSFLDSIGAYFVPHDNNIISIGPFGGTGGHPFDDGTYTTVKKIEVRHGTGFVSIQTVYDNNGVERWSGAHGTIAGGTVDEVKLDYKNNEFLVSFSGYLTDDSDDGVVQALIFTSNTNKTYGPYGTTKGKFFSNPSNGGKIVGFFGRSGQYINSIGAHLKPLAP